MTLFNNKFLTQTINKITRKITLITGFGKKISQEKDYIKAEFLKGEVYKKVPIIQHYGFKSVPPKDSDLFAVCNGRRENLTIVGSKKKDVEPTDVEEGEISLYGKKIKINCDDVNVLREIITALETVHGDLNALAEGVLKAGGGPVIPYGTKNQTSKLKKVVK
ncbi:hypothetical protein CMO94_02460 [Candidatus Woesearchaeota archaeon]|jgi:phage gp45-like|nr:hypothetical protein [Candidatus Woesearchaeota archaeon]